MTGCVRHAATCFAFRNESVMMASSFTALTRVGVVLLSLLELMKRKQGERDESDLPWRLLPRSPREQAVLAPGAAPCVSSPPPPRKEPPALDDDAVKVISTP